MANTKVTSNVISDDITLGGNPTTTTQSAGNNTTRIATTAFVKTAIDATIDSAPGALDTLNELAAAIGDDANFSTTVTNSIATKLPLAGGTMTGDLILGDNVKVEIGSASGGDLQLYHDGSDSYISDAGTGILKIKGSEIRIQSTSGENMAIFNPDGAVQLQYDNSTKLSTTSTGVSSTGYAISNNTALFDDHSTLSAYSDTNGVYLNGKNAGWLSTSADGTQRTYARFFGQSNSGGEFIQFNVADATRMKIDSSGKIVHSPAAQGSAFDASDNTTWNALEIFQDRGVTNSGSGIAFRSQSGTNPAGIVSVAGNTTGGIEGLAFITVAGNAGAERMRIASDGNVGIGDTDPDYLLDMSGTIGDQAPLQRWTVTGTPSDSFNWVTEAMSANLGQDKRIVHAFGKARSNGNSGTMSYVPRANSGDNAITFGLFGKNDILNITYNGYVGIGQTSPEGILHIEKASSGSSYTADGADQLILENNDSVGMDIRTPSSNAGMILFSDNDARGRGQIAYYHSSDTMAFLTAAAQGMEISSVGNVSVSNDTLVPANMAGLQVQSGGLLINGTSAGGSNTIGSSAHHSNYWTFIGSSGRNGSVSGSFRIEVPDCSNASSNHGYGGFSVEIYISGYNGVFCHAMVSGYNNSGISISESAILRSAGSHSLSYGIISGGTQGIYVDIDIPSYTHSSAYYRITKGGDQSSDHQTDFNNVKAVFT